jgi:flavin reductase (DIM6/NTAB) family NADH-FMN oxidoreductase RutF
MRTSIASQSLLRLSPQHTQDMSDATSPPDPVAETLALWSPLLAVTTHHDGRSNGLVAGTGVFASVIPEAPRVLVELTKSSLTHDLFLASRGFALHTLPATPHDALTTSRSLVRALGMRSGHQGDKMAGLAARPGVTGSPILTDTLTYVEARVVSMLDAEELTIFLADVVGGGRLRSGAPLALSLLREHLPKEWLGEWAASRERQVAEAWRRRGLR